MNPPPGYYYRPPRIGLDAISVGWKLFLQEWKAWVLATTLWGIIGVVVYAGAAIPTGVWSMYTFAIRSGFAESASNDDGSWPPYHNIGQELAASFGFLLVNAAVWMISLGGLSRMGLKQLRGQPVSAFDAFDVRDRVLPLIGLAVVTFVPIVVSSDLCFFPVCILLGIWMFAPILIVDERMGVIGSLKRSVELTRSNWLAAAVFVFVDGLFAGLGSFALVVGTIATYAAAMIGLLIAYEECRNTIVPIPGHGVPTPDLWSPPPTAEPQAPSTDRQDSPAEPPAPGGPTA